MKALAWISVVGCIIYGALAFAIYEKSHAEALKKSRNLQKVEATVLRTQRCQGKSLCYFTIVQYRVNKDFVDAKVLGEVGKQGSTISLFVTPGSNKGFTSPAEYIEQATAFMGFLLLPFAIFLFPLLLAVAAKYEKSVRQTFQDKQPARVDT
jgi:hypothetical protein